MGFLKDIIKVIFGKNENLNSSPKIIKIAKPNLKKSRIEMQNTKTFQIKKHLIEKGSIDSWTAIEIYGVTRLSAIIFNLRMNGYNIESINNTAYDRNQELCNFTTYKYINYNGAN